MSHENTVFQKAFNSVNVENWRESCHHGYKRKEFYWERDQQMDKLPDRFVINLEDDSDDSNESESELERESNDVAVELE
ncbi:hypothetical protein L9F63_022231 [Diploptera punctata]|uniref:Uncharacterized protein n=1 Tax=Diploptera punctata TaxID=6984 RepID=A0AAD7ZMW4_DIPPU|nr:hypothetical protein L9F63_022231 [Diploptera punctata]